ncbi:hypothetical protein LSH36_97g07100 [Paralvinella palmiformis]|uniref:Uncharacterized protein n=1 Tax=Paralvinella palmiformis TaxID=53620 RepID=A0AAD9K0N7_9ANNE|nr:hypothetical protein LSH36_97g07100 [Paralvinella palmiformis]
MRLSSHQLRVETGHWAQITFEQRTCEYNTGIQSEHHILLSCPRSQTKISTGKLQQSVRTVSAQLADYCRLILNLYRT